MLKLKNDLVKIGKNTWIGDNVRYFGEIEIGDGTIIEDGVVIGAPSTEDLIAFRNALSKGEKVEIGEFISRKTTVGEDCIIRSGTVIHSGAIIGDHLDCYRNVLIGDMTRIGNNVYIMDSTQIFLDVKIGNNVRLSGFCANRSIIEDNVSMLGYLVHKYEQPVGGYDEKAPVIKKGAVVGMLALVVGGVIVDKNAYVGAGAMVTKDVPSNWIVAGCPAKKIGERTRGGR